MNSNSSTTGSASRAKSMAASMAALQGLLTATPPRVSHKIDLNELQEKAARIAMWSAWHAMRAEDAARKAEPSRPRPPCQTSTRLTESALARRPFEPIGNRHTRALTESTLTYLTRKPFAPLREYPSLHAFAAARAKGPEALHQLTERAQRSIRAAVLAST